MKIIPTVLAFNKKDFDKRFKRLLAVTSDIQIDLMDGRFVKTKSIPLSKVPNVKRYKNKRFEAHLMVKEPMPWAVELINKGYKRIIVHYEALDDLDIARAAKLIRKLGAKMVLALNPDTPVSKVIPHAKEVDGILFLGVHPGKNAAPYVKKTPARIRQLASKVKVAIQVDGGITTETIAGVAKAGATRVNSGSFVSNAKDPKKALEELRKAAI